MNFLNLKNKFVENEPRIADYVFEDFTTLKQYKTIVIKINFDSHDVYPFTISPSFLDFTLYNLKRMSLCNEIYVTNNFTQDEYQRAVKILPSQVNLVNSTYESDLILNASLIVSLNTLVFHYHHFARRLVSCTSNVSSLSTSISQDMVYCIVDARLIGTTNEHSYFNRTKIANKILTGFNPQKIDAQLRLKF